jgi:ArsR family transcriptional regulator, arsenate/arsenite/antimonite-responsive transcriptional repressor
MGARMSGPAIDRMFRAFSDRTRLRILHLLEDHGEICVGDMVSAIQAPQTTISRHLAYLRRAGLVRVRKSGLWKHYSLEPARSPVHRRLLGCLRGCFGEVRELAADRRRYERMKEGGCPSPLKGRVASGRRRPRAPAGFTRPSQARHRGFLA